MRLVVALLYLICFPLRCEWQLEPRLYGFKNIGTELLVHYSFSSFLISTGIESIHDNKFDQHQTELNAQITKVFEMNDNWAFGFGLGSSLDSHWYSDYQFRYQNNQFDFITAGYRYHEAEDSFMKNEFYIGYVYSVGHDRSSSRPVCDSPSIIIRPIATQQEVSIAAANDTDQNGALLTPTQSAQRSKLVTYTARVHFASSQYVKDDISEIVNLVKILKDPKIVIKGYADSSGDSKFNKWLSSKRAKYVQEELESLVPGIKSIDSVGYGFSDPVATNQSPLGRAWNRRVEISITGLSY